MRILVTGATGFIGNHVVSRLLEEGHQVVATSYHAEAATRHHWFPHVEYCPHDLNATPATLIDRIGVPDTLIHLSWPGLPDYRGLFNIENNLPASYTLIKALLERGLSRCVVVGTCLEYGLQNGCLHEGCDTRPTLPYAVAKNSLREFLQQLFAGYPADLKWLRLFYMHGPGQAPSSLLSLLDQALDRGDHSFNMSGGEQLRDYLPVETVAQYIAAITLQDRVSGIINCCSGTPISIRRLVEQHLEKSHRSITLKFGHYPYPDYEPMAFWGDRTKLDTAIGPLPTLSP